MLKNSFFIISVLFSVTQLSAGDSQNSRQFPIGDSQDFRQPTIHVPIPPNPSQENQQQVPFQQQIQFQYLLQPQQQQHLYLVQVPPHQVQQQQQQLQEKKQKLLEEKKQLEEQKKPAPSATVEAIFQSQKNCVQVAQQQQKKPETNELPKYVCEYCGHRGNWRSNMARHKRKHTGEKPYLCGHCGDRFSNSSNRRKHEKGCKVRTEAIAVLTQKQNSINATHINSNNQALSL